MAKMVISMAHLLIIDFFLLLFYNKHILFFISFIYYRCIVKFYIGNSVAFLLLIFLPFIIYLSRHSLAGLSSFRHKLALFLRIILILLLILALAEIQLVVKSKLLTILYLLDVSKSVSASAQEQAIEFIHRSMKKMKSKKDQASLLVFGRDASFEFLNEKNDESFDSILSQVSTEQTDIAGAIKLAIAGLPEIGQRRIVLISDGNETVGKALIEAEKCRSQNVTLDVVPITFASDKEVLIEKLVGPSEVHERQTYEITAIIRSQRDTTGSLHFFISDQQIFKRKVTLKKGKNSITIPIPGDLVKAGFQKLKVIIDSPDDYIASNNMGETFSYIRGVPRVLLIDPNPNHRQFLYRALGKKVGKKEKIKVIAGTVADIPRDILTLHSYDALILSNVPRDYLKDGQMRLIESAVKESGMGLIMIGGEASFGAGGYKDTPIEKALPVTMDILHKKVIPNGALAIVLHTCEFAQGNRWGKMISKKSNRCTLLSRFSRCSSL